MKWGEEEKEAGLSRDGVKGKIRHTCQCLHSGISSDEGRGGGGGGGVK